MQKLKYCNGTMLSLGDPKSRKVSYGEDSTTTCYKGVVDFINTEIANFLHDDCGVDASYGAHNESDDAFLWICGIPFLFMQPKSSGSLISTLYEPFNPTGSNSNSGFTKSETSREYAFSMHFVGNPKTGFVLSVATINNASVSNGNLNAYFRIAILKGRNFITGKDGVVYRKILNNSTSNDYKGYDLNEDGIIDEIYKNNVSFTSSAAHYLRPDIEDTNPDTLPLIPFICGQWLIPRIYMNPIGYTMVPPQGIASISQTETEIGGKRFLVTLNYINPTHGASFNLPLIELDD